MDIVGVLSEQAIRAIRDQDGAHLLMPTGEPTYVQQELMWEPFYHQSSA
jgi:hypothetical protein